MAIDREAVVAAILAGDTRQQIANRHGCAKRDIQQALDDFAAELLMPAARARQLATEVYRMDQLLAAFSRQAMEDRDAAAGTLCAKLSQRKSALLGLDQPLAVKMDLAVSVVPAEETSTESLRRVLDELITQQPPQLGPPPEPVLHPAGEPEPERK